MGDIVGRLFREFAVTLAVAIFDLRRSVADADADDVRTHAQPRVAAQAEPFFRRLRTLFDRVIAQYGQWLKTVLNHPRLTLGVAVGTRR